LPGGSFAGWRGYDGSITSIKLVDISQLMIYYFTVDQADLPGQ